jgi:dolichyl-phosphate beta-glucosyltransferase
MKKSSMQFAFSLLMGLFLFSYTLRYVEIDKSINSIQNARPDYLVTSLLLIICAYVIRGFRWMIWEKNLKFWNSFKLILIGFMGNNLLPARLGEVLRAHCTAQKTADGYGRTAALASIAIERILDGLVLSVISILGLLFVPINNMLFIALLSVSLAFGLLTASLIVSIRMHKRIRKVFDGINRIFPGHLTQFGKEKINYFLDGLLLIGNFTKLVKAIIVSAFIWIIELAAYYLIANSVFNEVSIKVCLLFLAVVNFASLFPFTVGGFGAIEGAATAFLVSAGIPANQSLAMVLSQHILQFAFTTITGIIFYFTGKYYNLSITKNKSDAQKTKAAELASKDEIIIEISNQIEGLAVNLAIVKKTKREIFLSIVIPSYNEQKRLPKTVLETIAWCKQNLQSYELIIADDGSTDETPNIAKLFAEQISEISFIACPHMGKGATVRTGMLNASGKYALFMDADGATPLSEIRKLIAKMEEGIEIVIGSRVRQSPGETEVITSLHRRLIGRTFAALVNIFAISGFGDTQCGFKMFKHEIIRDIFTKQKCNGFAFDVEILFIAKKLSLTILELPVNWVNQDGSKVNIMTDSIKMLFDIMRIRWIHREKNWAVKEDGVISGKLNLM